MIEILSGNLETAIKELEINAVKTYQGKYNKKYPYQEVCQVWEVDEIEFDKMKTLSENKWHDDWGWWRSAIGSNMFGTITDTFIINGKEIEAWFGHKRESFENELENHIDDYDREDYREDFKDDLLGFEKFICGERKYDNLLNYFCEEIGVSTETNICALAVDLAKINNIKMSELFEIYQG